MKFSRHNTLQTVAASFLLGACAELPPGSDAASQCNGTASENREVVLSFYRLGLIGRRLREAFEQFAAPAMVEHKPDVPDGTCASVVKYLEALMTELPQAQWEILRVAAEGDLVFLHAKFVPQPDAEPYAIADVFRLRDCKIVEHWDVVASPPSNPVNPNSRF
jgi:predicted SnoaL-like aldol condensation-catalyzing enzyme